MRAYIVLILLLNVVGVICAPPGSVNEGLKRLKKLGKQAPERPPRGYDPRKPFEVEVAPPPLPPPKVSLRTGIRTVISSGGPSNKRLPENKIHVKTSIDQMSEHFKHDPPAGTAGGDGAYGKKRTTKADLGLPFGM